MTARRHPLSHCAHDRIFQYADLFDLDAHHAASTTRIVARRGVLVSRKPAKITLMPATSETANLFAAFELVTEQ